MHTEQLPQDVAGAHAQVLTDVLEHGAVLDADAGSRSSREILTYSTGMQNPRARVVGGAASSNTVGAVARFTWLVAGSDRLEDIAYYEKRVRSYSDDKLTVPGSSYGKRLFNARPGTNQIEGVIDELRTNPHSRRAAAVVWLPEDAVRRSQDIPCTFGLFFHIRDGALSMTTVMRSNNAVTLVPYNFFEFSMLGEMVAAELAVPLGVYRHWAASMHIFDADTARARSIIDAGPPALTMPPMPSGDAYEKSRQLARFEAAMRHTSTLEEAAACAADAHAELGDYWAALFDVLYAYVLAKRQYRREAEAVLDALPEYLATPMTRKTVLDALQPEPPAEPFDDALFSAEDLTFINDGSVASVVALTSDHDDMERTLLELAELSTDDAPVTVTEMQEVLRLRRHDVSLAARDAAAAATISNADIAGYLDQVRRGDTS